MWFSTGSQPSVRSYSQYSMQFSGQDRLCTSRGLNFHKQSFFCVSATRLASVCRSKRLTNSNRQATLLVQSVRTASQVDASAVVQRLAQAGIEVPDSAAMRNPNLSISSEEQITSKVEPMLEFLVVEQKLKPHDIEVMLLRCPKLFSFSVERQCRPVVSFLASLGFNQQQVSATIRRFPHMLGYDTKGHLVPHCHYLKSLGLTDEELPALILARPHVLGISIELVITYLRKWLRVERTHVGQLLWSYPLDYSLPRLVMPSTLEATIMDSTDATIEEDFATDNPSANTRAPADSNSSNCSSSNGEGSSAAAQRPDGDQQLQKPLPPLGSPERCTWLDLDLNRGDEGQSGISR